MARVTLSLPDELAEWARRALPGLNLSEVLRRGLTAALACEHAELVCACCSQPVARQAIADEAMGRFYADAIDAIDRLVQAGGTCEGSARVVKDVGERHRVTLAATLPLPRPSRARRRQLDDQEWLAAQPYDERRTA